MEKKKIGRPRKTISDSEKIDHKEALRAYTKRMRDQGYLWRGAWVKATTWEKIQQIAREEGISAGEVINRLVVEVTKSVSRCSKDLEKE